MREELITIKNEIRKAFTSLVKDHKSRDVMCQVVIEKFDAYIAISLVNDSVLHNLPGNINSVLEAVKRKKDKLVIFKKGVLMLRKIIDDNELIVYVGDYVEQETFDIYNTINKKHRKKSMAFIVL